jgi:hypothetical protein
LSSSYQPAAIRRLYTFGEGSDLSAALERSWKRGVRAALQAYRTALQGELAGVLE